MKNPPVNIIESVLTVKASGNCADIQNDLSLPEGKSIAQLIYEEENKEVISEKTPEN